MLFKTVYEHSHLLVSPLLLADIMLLSANASMNNSFH